MLRIFLASSGFWEIFDFGLFWHDLGRHYSMLTSLAPNCISDGPLYEQEAHLDTVETDPDLTATKNPGKGWDQ
jgi:hypothetical protein